MKEYEHSGQTIPKGKRFCACCGEVKRETAFEGESDHCRACCEQMLKTRLHVPGFLVCLALIGAAVFAAVLIPWGKSVSDIVRMARSFEEQHFLYSACDAYNVAVDRARAGDYALFGGSADKDEEEGTTTPRFFCPGTRVWREYCRAYARAYTRTEAAEFAAAHLDKQQIESTQPMASYAEASRDYESVMTQVKKVQAQYTYSTPEDMPFDQIVKALDAYVESRDTANVRGYAAYLKGTASWYQDPSDPDRALRYFDEMLENVPDEYVSAYSGIAQIGLDSEQPDVLLRAAEGVLEKNKEHGDAWSWKVQAQFDAGDIKAAQQTAKEMRRVCPEDPLCAMLSIRVALRQEDLQAAAQLRSEAADKHDDYADALFNTLLSKRELDQSQEQFLRGYIRLSTYEAASCLLEGDLEAAFAYGYDRAFNYAYYYASITNDGSLMTQSVFNIAALCASLTDNEEALDTIAQYGDCDDATRDVINGKISLADAFCKGKAVLL